ncbi:MAG: signal peptidase I [Patescibacteria group bacterium]|nr:signal peptidase I [Patescibacteria group bacterium]
MRNFLIFIWEILKIVIIAVLIVAPIRYFIFQPFLVKGQSMEPNFENGDYLIIDEISYRFRDLQRGEVVVFKYPQNPSQRFIKRIVGLPGETIEIEGGKVIIYQNSRALILDESSYLPPSLKTPGDIRISLGKDEYFVLGDNRFSSFDSRRWGPLPRENIIGRVFLRLWPFSALAKIEAPAY